MRFRRAEIPLVPRPESEGRGGGPVPGAKALARNISPEHFRNVLRTLFRNVLRTLFYVLRTFLFVLRTFLMF